VDISFKLKTEAEGEKKRERHRSELPHMKVFAGAHSLPSGTAYGTSSRYTACFKTKMNASGVKATDFQAHYKIVERR